MRFNSGGNLYPFFGSSNGAPPHALSITTAALWHRRLGHLIVRSRHPVGNPKRKV
jgi:hypothetical protein